MRLFLLGAVLAHLLFALAGCADDPNAGRFPPGSGALILGLRYGLELGAHVP